MIWTALKTAAIILCMCMLVPLVVLLGSGSWRQAWYALRQYLLIMGGMVALVGGFALLVTLVELMG